MNQQFTFAENRGSSHFTPTDHHNYIDTSMNSGVMRDMSPQLPGGRAGSMGGRKPQKPRGSMPTPPRPEFDESIKHLRPKERSNSPRGNDKGGELRNSDKGGKHHHFKKSSGALSSSNFRASSNERQSRLPPRDRSTLSPKRILGRTMRVPSAHVSIGSGQFLATSGKKSLISSFGNSGKIPSNHLLNTSYFDINTLQSLHVSPKRPISSPRFNQAQIEAARALVQELRSCIQQGKKLMTAKKFKQAVREFSKILRFDCDNPDARFYRGVCYLDWKKNTRAIEDLTKLIEKNPLHKKIAYIVLSIAYRRSNDYLGSLRTLSRGIMHFPKYAQAYQARGQLFIFGRKFDKALCDFRTAQRLQPELGHNYLGIGDSLKCIGNYHGALKEYTKAMEVDQMCRIQALLKRGRLYYLMKYYDYALDDFDELLVLSQNNPKAFLFKGLIYKKQDKMPDAVLFFQQVMKHHADDQQLAGTALFEIAKIRVAQRDFYEANFNLKRAAYLKFKSKKMQLYKIFTDGVIDLMKRKTASGVKILSQLEKLQVKGVLKPLGHIYRAYGYMVLEQYEKALKDYNKANVLRRLDPTNIYNKQLCQGIVKMQALEFESAIAFFTRAIPKFKHRTTGYVLRAIGIIKLAAAKTLSYEKRTKYITDARGNLDQALKLVHKGSSDAALYYMRGLLKFCEHNFYEGLTDMDKAIDKVDDAKAEYYLARGRCYACLSMFKEAILDLSSAINLNKNLMDAYLNRGKCAYLIGDTGLAFMDFQKLILLEPKNPIVHIYAGNLLMTTGSYEDATKAFSNAWNIHRTPLALYQRARCYVALTNIEAALKDLHKVIECSPDDKVAHADRECLLALKLGKIKQQSAFSTAGGPTGDLGVFQKGCVMLTKQLNIEQIKTIADINHNSSILHSHSQIIPNANRTKYEKMKAIRHNQERERMRDKPRNQLETPHPSWTHDSTYDAIMRGDDRQLPSATDYYKENIFNRQDFFLYRGVMHFYAGDYSKALSDFESSSGVMHANKVLNPLERDNIDELSDDSAATDLSDVGLCSLNIHEFTYNSMLCLWQMKDYQGVLKKVTYLIQTTPIKYLHKLWIIRGLVNQTIGNQSAAKQDIEAANKYDLEHAKRILDKETIQYNIFPIQNRLCSHFASHKFTLPGGYSLVKMMKPSFSFPFIKPPNMIPIVDPQYLNEIDISLIKPVPQAPWIKRGAGHFIKFTDEINYTELDFNQGDTHRRGHHRESHRRDQKSYRKPKAHSQKGIVLPSMLDDDSPEWQQTHEDAKKSPEITPFLAQNDPRKALADQLRNAFEARQKVHGAGGHLNIQDEAKGKREEQKYDDEDEELERQREEEDDEDEQEYADEDAYEEMEMREEEHLNPLLKQLL